MTFSKTRELILEPRLVATDDPVTGDVTVKREPTCACGHFEHDHQRVVTRCPYERVTSRLVRCVDDCGCTGFAVAPSTFDKLCDAARALLPMTEEQRILQKIDFIWGNLAASTNHQPASKDAVATVVWREEWLKLRAKLEELRGQVESIRQTLDRL